MSEESNPELLDFAELSKDAKFTATMSEFHEHVDKIGNFIQAACSSSVYDELSLEDKVKYDLFMTYSMNSLFWLYLRTQGLDPLKHPVKSEIDRVRTYNTRAKQVYDRKYVMKHIDKEAAGRFIRSGLWEPKEKSNENVKEPGT
ncbi:Uncharacterized protein GBIM_20155 [Gryllus bimaculatus]|nr:Uncharacterized protein GBIM_20155 [Gryllus bimaculatus]